MAGLSSTLTAQEARPELTPRAKPAPGQAEAEARRLVPNLRTGTDLVLIPVTVTTPLNQFVTGMEKENFRLLEDKQEQEIAYFASFDAPLSIGLVFDTSGSMGAKLQKARQAVAEFFRTANPEDEFFLVAFSDRPKLMVPFTRATEEIQTRLTFTQSRGRTALLDGIYLALEELRKAHNPRRALLVVSDGGDNSSRYTETEVRNLVREADAQLYAIGIFEDAGGRMRTAEEMNGPSLLSELAGLTGGRHFPVDNLNDLPDIAAKIGIELRNEYVLGYVSKNKARDGKYRRVQVKLKQPRGLPPLKAAYRQGYYAPAE